MTVVQLLEGPAPAVRDLFATIMVDPRHTGCQLTNEELLFSQDEYLFGSNWGMLQSETVGHGLLDLSAHLWQAYHARAADEAMGLEKILPGALSSAEAAWEETPCARSMM